MAFSATEAAFSGLRLSATRPWALAAWSLGVFAVSLLYTVGMAAVAGSEFALLTSNDAQSVAQVDWRAVGLGYLVVLAFALGTAAVLYTAVYRAVLSPEQSRFAYVRFGADELRMAALCLIVFLAMVLVMMAAMFAIIIPFSLVAAAAGGSDGGGMAAGLVGVLMVLLALPVVFALAAWLGVRLSLAGPMTFDTRRIQLGAAWRLTRGRFWPLFGAYALSWIFLMMVWAVSTPLSMAIAAAASGESFFGMWTNASTIATSTEEALRPARLIYLALNSLFAGLGYTIWLAPTADAYRQLRPDTQVAETFA
jgi:hypothetical protein